MRIFNSDGSEPEMCGNGIRCLARFVAEKDASGPVTQRIHTLAGMFHSLSGVWHLTHVDLSRSTQFPRSTC